MLMSKVLSESAVELKWFTSGEKGNAGFILQRRKNSMEDYVDVASYKSTRELKSKGAQGGEYSYIDETLPKTGLWDYRLVDVTNRGEQSAIGQKTLDIQSQNQKFVQIGAGVLLAGLLIGAFVLTSDMK